MCLNYAYRYKINTESGSATPAESTEHVITIRLERIEKLECTQQPAVCARIVRHVKSPASQGSNLMSSKPNKGQTSAEEHGSREGATSDRKEHVLINSLHAKCQSVVSSVTRTMCRAEHASHLLIWGELDNADSDAAKSHHGDAVEEDGKAQTESSSGSIRLASVDMMRLDAKFVIRNVSKAAEKPRPALFSEARNHMRVFDVYV